MNLKINQSPYHKGIIQGIILYLITFAAVLALNFFLPRAMPGNPISALLGPDSQVSLSLDPEIKEQLLKYYQLDLPLYKQYLHYLGETCKGKLGWGIYFQQPVADLIKNRAKWSLFLIIVSSLLSLFIALPLAARSAMHRGKRIDTGLLTSSLILMSIPVFLLAMGVVVIFSVKLNWLPLAGAMSEFSVSSSLISKAKDILWHSLGPLLVLSLSEIPSFYLIGRSSMLDALDQPWMEFAVMRGISKTRVITAYLIPAGLLPVITRLGMHVAFLITNTIFVETVFSYPGLGRLLFQAIQVRDYPVLQGVFLVMTIAVLGANFLVDISYRFLDPRIDRLR
jgi:peptide/nickel transport system permease protein